MEEITEAVDYISQLPEPILQYIMSFLSITQIVQTSVISKTWYQAWNTFQILEFDFYTLFRRNNLQESNKHELYNFVEQILVTRHRQMISLKKFTVIMTWIYQEPETVSTLDRWIKYALESRVKDLKIVVGPFNFDEEYKYDAPPSIFSAKYMQILHLENCKLTTPSSSGLVNLSQLKKIKFRTVYLDDNFISKILAGCPQLEDLSLVYCFGVKNLLVVPGLVKLINIEIENLNDLNQLKIEAPNLQSIDLKVESWPSAADIATCKNLKKLTVSFSPVSDKWLQYQLKQLPQLEDLCLLHCPELKSIKISGSNLQELYIHECVKLVLIEINTPCLHNFSYCGDIISFSSNNLMLPKALLEFMSSNYMDSSWYIKLLDLLTNFSHCFKELNLRSKNGMCYIVPRELRQSLVPPLYNFKELNLKISAPYKSYPTAKLVDAMLWISPHLKSLTINTMTYCSFKFSYQNEGEAEAETLCFKNVPVLCWRDCIKNVKIRQISCNINTMETEERSYHFNEDIWENIESGILDWVPDYYL